MKKGKIQITSKALCELLLNNQYKNVEFVDARKSIHDGFANVHFSEGTYIEFDVIGDDLPDECDDSGNDIIKICVSKNKFDSRVPELNHRMYVQK